MTVFEVVIELLSFVTQTNVCVMGVFNKICGKSILLKNYSFSFPHLRILHKINNNKFNF
jgi:hypothetical protein